MSKYTIFFNSFFLFLDSIYLNQILFSFIFIFILLNKEYYLKRKLPKEKTN